MKHKCYISFKYEDVKFKEIIQEYLGDYYIDKSLNVEIDSTNEDYILRRIREDYISDSTVTIFLVGERSAENLGEREQKYIKRELQASLYNGENNTRNGILGIVLPNMYHSMFLGNYECRCHQNIQAIDVQNTTVTEFSYNYFIPNGRCHHTEDERYCVLVKWDDFIKNPEEYIDKAFDKRTAPIATKVKVKP